MNNDSPLTDDQNTALGLAIICCCMLAAVITVGVIVYFIARRKPASPAMNSIPAGLEQLHLSVMAFALESTAYSFLTGNLAAPYSTATPALARAELVRRVCSLLLQVEGQWRAFGYGEKDLIDLGTAEQSYRHALDDFRARATFPADPLGTQVVVTLILATRGPLQGVSKLNDVNQIREVLRARSSLDAGALLGAEIVWSPSGGNMSESMVLQRFPEMVPLPR